MWGVEGQLLGFLASTLKDGQNAVGCFTQIFLYFLGSKYKIALDFLS
jgi:uncharacterized membrane protein YeaQ/YmgE (transglycosylase-associated protein family)